MTFGCLTTSFWPNYTSNRLIMESTVVCMSWWWEAEVNGYLCASVTTYQQRAASEVHCGKAISAWKGQTLTLGLLRGLVDRPEDAPLIDRDLRNTHKVRQTNKPAQYTGSHTEQQTTQHNNTHTHNRCIQNPKTSLCGCFRNPTKLNSEQIAWDQITFREKWLKRGRISERKLILLLQFSTNSFLTSSSSRTSLSLLFLSVLVHSTTCTSDFTNIYPLI